MNRSHPPLKPTKIVAVYLQNTPEFKAIDRTERRIQRGERRSGFDRVVQTVRRLPGERRAQIAAQLWDINASARVEDNSVPDFFRRFDRRISSSPRTPRSAGHGSRRPPGTGGGGRVCTEFPDDND